MFLRILVFSVLSRVLSCANLLIVCPTPSYSHEIALIGVWNELGTRGHNITIISAFPPLHKSPNFTVIDITPAKTVIDTLLAQKTSGVSKWLLPYVLEEISMEIVESLLSTATVQDVLRNQASYKFDAVITEIWHPIMFTWSRVFHCPLITYATIDVYEIFHWHLGNQIHHVYLPDMNSGSYEATDFQERLENFFYTTLEISYHYLIFRPERYGSIRRYFGEDMVVTAGSFNEEVDLVLVNSHPIFRSVRAVGPTTIMVGGGNHILPPKDLQGELKTYLDSATNGFIYLSLGTIVRSDNIGSDLLDVLVEVMRKLPYKILWKIEEDSLQEKPANVRTIGWAPQQDILRHPNIKLFISQGGIQSIEEAIFSNVPMLVIPFFGDQHKNAQLVTAKGIGLSVQHKPELDKVELESTIYELIKNPMYKNTARRLATLMNDTYMTGLEKSIWWIEYVIRNNGTKELRNPAAKLPFYQYYALDVIGFIVLCIVVTIKLLVVLTRSIFRILTSQDSSRRRKEKKM